MVLESEVAKLLDLSVIRYSRVWEDHQLLERSLDIRPDDVVLSITSSGDNVLNLLLLEPQKIVAIDMSASQNAVLDLKLAAIHMVPHEAFVKLIGIAPATGQERVDIYKHIRSNMSEYAQKYWDHNLATIESSIVKAGRLEKYFDTFHTDYLEKLVPIPVIEAICNAPTLAEQVALVQQHILSNPEVESKFRWYFGEDMLKRQGRDPAQMRFIKDGDISTYIWNKFRSLLTTQLLKDNPYMHVFLLGEYKGSFETAQPYLRPSNYERMRSLLPRLQVVTGSIEEQLSGESSPGSTPLVFSKANLSDIFEYMSAEAADALFLAFANKFRVGGRLAFWNLFVPRCPSDSLRTYFSAHTELAKQVHSHDRLFFYSQFHVEEITKSSP
ncbi:hypothetical protein CAOG_05065 [Capsaspora owczarzaki ATCC 30864]|uniref:hypothetical protein n=1 Tax=Capsaspora owczarzaki (strain ATCC 30864) TaxID=595528 RepID=UPI0001FE2B13|nr:hypothetical protein CAOG_05065 [Capsaspora owczarzaki ATCC 30864]|eukprot:XP_004346750.1 hypothetical protein CAOG_05065 [Capsaspora owczarzaki ATCC 30864]